MTLLSNSRFILIMILALNLAACGGPRVREEAPKQDLFELQKQADSSYLNDDLAASERDYETLIRELPEIALHWFRLANIYVRTNRPAAAINLYKEAILRDPTYAKAWFNMSIVQLKQTAYSLNEMLLYTDKNDPVYAQAKKLLDGIQAMVKQD